MRLDKWGNLQGSKAIYAGKEFYHGGAFVQHDTTEPIFTERKEIRTINGNLSEQPKKVKK